MDGAWEIWFLNVQERGGRCWEDFRQRGFLSSVGCVRVLDAIAQLRPGDHVAAYLRGRGYVGVGVVLARAAPVGTPRGEHLLPVRWLRAVGRCQARWQPHQGLFASPQVKAPLSRQPRTLRFLQENFRIVLPGVWPEQRAGTLRSPTRWQLFDSGRRRA